MAPHSRIVPRRQAVPTGLMGQRWRHSAVLPDDAVAWVGVWLLPICIKLSWEVRQEARPSVGARAADERLGGPLGSPGGGDGIVFHQAVSQGNRMRATECDGLSLG
ncbi:MAG TPA: hypothetical protein VF026_24110 [Ktedonobacteraceae bacterium]